MPDDRQARLDALHRGICRCRKCLLHASRTHAVPGEGPLDARAMLIGEAPGAEEDRLGLPFRGRSGQFLDELLAGAGLGREEVFITSSVKCRPPGNRRPHADELATCRAAWLVRQMELVHCPRVVLLGATAIRQVLGETGRLDALHGQVRRCDGRDFLLTYHPAAGMRFPAARRAMIADFRALPG